MKFYSTSGKVKNLGLEDAVTTGLAADGGLLMPEKIPSLDAKELGSLRNKSLAEIALVLLRKLFSEDLSDTDLQKLAYNAFNFPLKLVPISDRISALELYHGPTLAFKDFGARFLAAILEHYLSLKGQKIRIIVATSGDTGGAVAQAFHRSASVDVVLLYPSKKVSELQEKQLTTLGDNITALEVLGTFDDCQAMVKAALADADIQAQQTTTSANSINVARFIPQSFYYFWAWGQCSADSKLAFCVPSGNFGNLAAGIFAKRMGLPVAKFIAATNSNSTFIDYLNSGIFTPRPSVKTISNAMDVGNPSNFVRILDLYQQNYTQIKEQIIGYTVSDEQTADCIKRVMSENNYILDPHGAVGYWALEQYLKSEPSHQGILLETAHPAKFKDVIDPILGQPIDLPEPLAKAFAKESKSIRINPDFASFKEFLLSSQNV